MNPFIEWLGKKEGRFLSKWLQYFEVYEKFFSPFREKPARLLEIGVFKGGSIDLWKNYFKELFYIGVDIDPNCKKYEEPGVNIEIGDQENTEFLHTVVEKYAPFDIVLDDGGHYMKQQMVSFEALWPHVKEGGLYVIEDTHTSYDKKYTDKEPLTFMQYSYGLVDQIHGWYGGDAAKHTSYTDTIEAVHYYDSIVVLEKKHDPNPPAQVLAGKIPEEWKPKIDTRRWKDTL